jgi:hypothetical protein
MAEQSGKKFLDKRSVGARYDNRHIRTIERWTAAGVLPKPDLIIKGRWYWEEASLDAHDRQRTIASATPERPGTRTPIR